MADKDALCGLVIAAWLIVMIVMLYAHAIRMGMGRKRRGEKRIIKEQKKDKGHNG